LAGAIAATVAAAAAADDDDDCGLGSVVMSPERKCVLDALRAQKTLASRSYRCHLVPTQAIYIVYR